MAGDEGVRRLDVPAGRESIELTQILGLDGAREASVLDVQTGEDTAARLRVFSDCSQAGMSLRDRTV